MGSGSSRRSWQRFAGGLIDGMLGAVAAIPGLILYFGRLREGWAGSMGAEADPEAASRVVLQGAVWLSIGSLLLAIYQWYLITKTGQSLAKRWLGMRIVREESGQLPGFVHGVVLRSWISVSIGLIPYFGGCVGLVDAIAIFFGDRRQTLHDRIARTLVIRD